MRQNLARVLSFVVFVLIGIVIGIWQGSLVDSDMIFFWYFDNRILLVITGDTSFFKYLFFIVFECAVLAAILFALSLHYYLSFFGYLVFIYKGYVIAFNVAILLTIAKLSCLPFVLLCFIPFSIFVLFCLIIIATKLACDSSYALQSRCRLPIRETLTPLVPIFITLFILGFIESILTFILTSGIVI